MTDRPRAAGPHAPTFRVPPHANAVHVERDGAGRHVLYLEYVARRPDRVTIADRRSGSVSRLTLGTPASVKLSGTGERIGVIEAGTLKVFSTSSGRELGSVRLPGLAGDGRLLALGKSGEWAVCQWSPLRDWPLNVWVYGPDLRPRGSVGLGIRGWIDVAFDERSDRLITASDDGYQSVERSSWTTGGIRSVSLGEWDRKRSRPDWLTSSLCSVDAGGGTVAIGSHCGRLGVYNCVSGEVLFSRRFGSAESVQVALSAGGEFLAVGLCEWFPDRPLNADERPCRVLLYRRGDDGYHQVSEAEWEDLPIWDLVVSSEPLLVSVICAGHVREFTPEIRTSR